MHFSMPYFSERLKTACNFAKIVNIEQKLNFLMKYVSFLMNFQFKTLNKNNGLNLPVTPIPSRQKSWHGKKQPVANL
jgi:hypothetical protein